MKAYKAPDIAFNLDVSWCDCSRKPASRLGASDGATSNGEAGMRPSRERNEITGPTYADIVRTTEPPTRPSDNNSEINGRNDHQTPAHTAVIYSELQALNQP